MGKRKPTNQSDHSNQSVWIAGACVLLAVAILAAFRPVFGNGFVRYDDQDYVTENTQVREGLTPATVAWAFSGERHANWHPITWLSHAADCEFFGLNPAGHHAVNVMLHILNSILLFLLLRFMTRKTWRSLLVASLFALHPLHVESVAWIAERKDLLSGLFFLLSLGAYVCFVSPGNGQRTEGAVGKPGKARLYLIAAYCASLVFYALGLMSKPMLVTLPFVLLLLDWWPLDRWRPGPGCLRTGIRLTVEKVPFFLLSAAASTVTMLVQEKARLYFLELPLEARLANAAIACVRYLGKTFWPSDLVVLYPHPGHWPSWAVAGAVALIVLITIGALWRGTRQPVYAVGWFWFIGMLVPVLGLVQVGVQSMADRYTYLPLIGVFLLIAWGAAELIDAHQRLKLVGMVNASVLLAACAIRTNQQARVWRDTETLFTHAATHSSDNWVAHYNLALLALERYQDSHRSSISAQAASQAKAMRRDYLAEIVGHCRAALNARPRFADAHATLGKALTEQGLLPEAKEHLHTAAHLDPGNAEVRQNIAEVCYRLGNVRQAIAEYRSALQLRPDWPPVLNNLAWILATHPDAPLRDGAEAVTHAEKACALSGGTNLWFLNTLAAAYAEEGNFEQAVKAAKTAHDLAVVAGEEALIEKTRLRLKLISSGKPIRDP